MTETIITSGQIMTKAGANCAANKLTATQYTQIINEAEAFLSTATKTNLVSLWGTISGNAVAKILSDAASSYAAVTLINYDMSGFTSRTEAQTMIDINWNKVVEVVNLLRDKDFKDFVAGSYS